MVTTDSKNVGLQIYFMETDILLKVSVEISKEWHLASP